MSLRDDLAPVVARDARYPIQAYAFVLEALEHTKYLRKRARAKARARGLAARARQPRGAAGRHVSGRELCDGARDLASRQYGLMAITVLAQWGIGCTGDIGNIVYNLIASGDLEKTAQDSRTDFDDVFDFETALRRDYVLALDEVA
jgi:uncharacterized repeat protein (TIGR04138 family)